MGFFDVGYYDVKKTKTGIEYIINIPGFSKKDVVIKANKDSVVIEIGDSNYLIQNAKYDFEQAEATVKFGQLKLDVPLKATKEIKIN